MAVILRQLPPLVSAAGIPRAVRHRLSFCYDWPSYDKPHFIRFGHSPDPDDAFMYYPLALGLVDTEGLQFVQVLEDIESLNRRAMKGELETTAASVHAAYISQRYSILPCGASMGDGYGPIVVTRRPVTQEDLPSLTIAVPGLMTSAYLALRLAIGEFRRRWSPSIAFRTPSFLAKPMRAC